MKSGEKSCKKLQQGTVEAGNTELGGNTEQLRFVFSTERISGPGQDNVRLCSWSLQKNIEF